MIASNEQNEHATVAVIENGPVIHWGAIFAGLTVILAGTLLLMILGAAIGVSVVDVTDMAAIGGGLAIGVAVWVVLSTLVVNFVGGLLAAHLSGRMTHASGLMHGVIVWSVGFVALVVVDAMVISGVVSAGAKVTQGAVTATSSVGGAMFSGMKALGSGAADLAASSYTDDLRARLKREAARVIANSEASGGAEVSQREMQTAIDNMDPQLLGRVAQEIVSGDIEEAKRTLRRGLDLSAAEVSDIVEGVSERVQTMAEESEAGQQVSQWLTEQIDSSLQAVSEMSGPEVSRQELQTALQQLDSDTSTAASRALLSGDPERAKTILAANTDLSETEITAIVDGVSASIEEEGGKILAEFKAAVETTSDYAQALLWLYFFAIALSLGAAAIGGVVGASGMSRNAIVQTRENARQ
jgi:hypothetical protein